MWFPHSCNKFQGLRVYAWWGELFILARRGKDSRLGPIGTERHNGALCCHLNESLPASYEMAAFGNELLPIRNNELPYYKVIVLKVKFQSIINETLKIARKTVA